MSHLQVAGYDISHWQGMFDHERAYEEGMRFCMVKCTTGEGGRDDAWPINRDKLLFGKTLFMPYHWLWAGVDAEAQARNAIGWAGGQQFPFMLDVEEAKDPATKELISAPTLAEVRDFIDAMAELGSRVSLLYLPQWYVQAHWNGADLTGLPPIVQSHYVGSAVATGSPEMMYPGDQDFRWEYLQGITPVILQFADRAMIAGKTPVDADAYRGELADLTQWFYVPDGFEMATDLNLKQVVQAKTADQPELNVGQILRMLPDLKARLNQFAEAEAARDAQEAQRDAADKARDEELMGKMVALLQAVADGNTAIVAEIDQLDLSDPDVDVETFLNRLGNRLVNG